MPIRHDLHDSVTGSGERSYDVTFRCNDPNLRHLLIAASHKLSETPAYVPKIGEPFDPPEEPQWPSDATAATVGEVCSYPDCNCPFDHPGTKDWCARGFSVKERTGHVLAQAQHEAAVSGDECTGAACLLTRGSD